MALTRKLLKGLGIDDEKIDTIIDAHSETVEALKAEATANADRAAQADELAKRVEELEQAAKESGDGDAKYKAEHEAFEAFKAEVEAGKAKQAKADAYTELLKGAGIDAKRIPSILKVTDLSGIELEDGKVKDAERLSEQAKEDWADFVLQSKTQGAQVDNPPKAGGEQPKSLADAYRMHYQMKE